MKKSKEEDSCPICNMKGFIPAYGKKFCSQQCKESYDLNIGKYYDLIKFYNHIKFIHDYKNNKLREVILDRTPKITKIKSNGVIDVYDFHEPENHWGVVNGYIAHNCGEITLCKSDSCRLLALNLFGYVVNPFTTKASFNFELFKEDIIRAQRYMDDIVDLEIEKILKMNLLKYMKKIFGKKLRKRQNWEEEQVLVLLPKVICLPHWVINMVLMKQLVLVNTFIEF